MKRLALILFFSTVACSSPIDEPANLIPKDKMAELIAEFALNEQMGAINPNGNMETNTIYILKQYGVTGKQFSDSYKFYLASPSKLDDIYDDAQDIIKEKDPEAEKFIEKKLKENKGIPNFAR